MIPSTEPSTHAANASADDRFLSLDGAQIRYRDEGRGAAVLLIHGWTLDLEIWESQVQALRADFRIIRYDRRGFGRSSGEPSIEQDVRDLGAILKHFELERVALVGMSQASRAAVAYACDHPDQVSCLVLDGPPEFNTAVRASNLRLAPFRELVHMQGLSAFREHWLRHPLMQLRTHDAATRELLLRVVERYPGNDLCAGALDLPAPDLWSKLASLTVPALVMTGEHDLSGRVRSADALARQFAAGSRAVITGSGHLDSLDNSDLYNRVLAAFLMRHADVAR
jgi:pimeloyl-ACP methyl ester carboxylesterase